MPRVPFPDYTEYMNHVRYHGDFYETTKETVYVPVSGDLLDTTAMFRSTF